MKVEVKLPKTYYAYANIDEATQPKDDKQRMAISLSVYLACKLEEHCYKGYDEPITFQQLFKQILVDKNVVTAEEINLKNTRKKKYEFLENDTFDCSKFENVKAYKQYLIYMSSYAKTKVIKYLIENEIDLSWFLKKELVKKNALSIEDLSK